MKKKAITYVGWTNNLSKRLELHNSSKGAKFTKGRKWSLIYKKKFNLKIKAMQYEYRLKKDPKTRKEIKNNYLKTTSDCF
jgi:putative endonuclease